MTGALPEFRYRLIGVLPNRVRTIVRSGMTRDEALAALKATRAQGIFASVFLTHDDDGVDVPPT